MATQALSTSLYPEAHVKHLAEDSPVIGVSSFEMQLAGNEVHFQGNSVQYFVRSHLLLNFALASEH